MPRLTDAKNVYAETGIDKMAESNRGIKPLVYVPSNNSNDVTVIDPETFQVIDRYPTGTVPQHVVPAWDMSVLYVNNNNSNSLTPIDPKTGKPGPNIAVDDPYNLYFTPDGKYAIVMEERNNTIAVRDAKTFAVVKKVRTPCRGVNHADYSIDGSYFIASCEFSAQLIKFDVATLEVVADRTIAGSMPQDVRVMSDGLTFLVADNNLGGVHVVDGERFEVIGFIATGAGAHGIYPSRNSLAMYVSNRLAGTGQRHRPSHSPGHLHLSHTGRRITRHGQRVGRWSRVVALGSLPQRRLRDRRARVEPARPHPGRIHAARPHVLSPTRPLLPRPHRQLPLTIAERSVYANELVARKSHTALVVSKPWMRTHSWAPPLTR